MSNNLASLIPRFNGEKFDYWSNLLKLCLESQDLWSVVEEGLNPPEDESLLTAAQRDLLRNREQKDRKALFQIYQALDIPVYERISKANNAHAAWRMLETTYCGQDQVKKVRLQSLRAEFEKLEMKDSEKIVEYFTRVTSNINQMASNGEVMETQKVVEKILRSLPKKFDHVVVAIEESQDLSTMSLECLQGRLEAHEVRILQRNPQFSPSQDQALKFKLKMGEGKLIDPTMFRSLVGNLMYLTATRPDIMFAVSLISRFMEKPYSSHWEAAKRILRYVKGTIDHGIFYEAGVPVKLVGYTDSDLGGSIDDSKSTSGYTFNLGSGTISWCSKKQPVVALSTTEAEYIAASSAGCQTLWLRGILENLKCKQDNPTTLFCDNSSAISVAKDPVLHGRTKHIRLRFHFIRELVNEGEVSVEYCRSDEQLADIFTKPLGGPLFSRNVAALGVKSKLGLREAMLE